MPESICMNGEADGKTITNIPRAVTKWRLRMRTDEPDRIFLKYKNHIEERHLIPVDDNRVKLSSGIIGINKTSPEPKVQTKKDFWKV